jgi:thiamine biosynthesis lipoprotein ApbE
LGDVFPPRGLQERTRGSRRMASSQAPLCASQATSRPKKQQHTAKRICSSPPPESKNRLYPQDKTQNASGLRRTLSSIANAKGFAVDRAIEALRAGGATQGIVNAGGDLAAFGPAPHPVYIRDPRHAGRVLAETDVFNGALATSGGRFDPMLSAAIGTCAVIDPVARAPARAILGATVRAPRCVFADALTKVVMIAGAASAPLLALYAADALFVGADGDLQISAGWREAVQLAA